MHAARAVTCALASGCVSVTAAPFPGVSECVCQDGFVEVDGQGCVPAGRGGAAGGAGASGKGAAQGADPNQKHHATCQQMFGPHAQFDGVDSCECKDGFSQVLSSLVPTTTHSVHGVHTGDASSVRVQTSFELLMCIFVACRVPMASVPPTLPPRLA